MDLKLSISASLALLFVCSPLIAEKMTVSGFVTTTGTPTDYRVNDIPVHCDAGKTINKVVAPGKKESVLKPICPPRVLGESVTVTGTQDKAGLITATVVEEDQPVDLPVKGVAMIDRVLEPLKDGRLLVRADGYALTIDKKTEIDFEDQDGRKYALGDVAPNVWITYKGELHTDGTVTVSAANMGHNVVAQSEDKLRTSNEFKAEEVKESDRQSAVGKAFWGRDDKRLPAYKDEAMQARITDIGNRLIPEYQRNLPASDPTKISFRFQLVDEPKLLGSADMPSGIILVPYQVVQKLTDDSEVAEILASGIADVLQKQAYRTRGKRNALAAFGYAADAAGLFVPGVGAASLVTGNRSAAVQRKIFNDCGRESLTLMNDAGFDMRSAPVTWWLLEANRKKRPLQMTSMPEISQYLYTVLWTTWSQSTTLESAKLSN